MSLRWSTQVIWNGSVDTTCIRAWETSAPKMTKSLSESPAQNLGATPPQHWPNLAPRLNRSIFGDVWPTESMSRAICVAKCSRWPPPMVAINLSSVINIWFPHFLVQNLLFVQLPTRLLTFLKHGFLLTAN